MKLLTMGVLGIALCLSTPTLADETQVSPVNGQVWLNSNNDAKAAFLLGFTSAVAQLYEQERNQPNADPARLVIDAMQGVTIGKLMDEINDYYKENPNDIDTPVTDVVWMAFVEQPQSGASSEDEDREASPARLGTGYENHELFNVEERPKSDGRSQD